MGNIYKIDEAESESTDTSPSYNSIDGSVQDDTLISQKEISVMEYGEGTGTETLMPGEIINSATCDISLENQLNAQSIARLRSEFSVKLLQLLRDQDFEYGVDSAAEELLRKCFDKNEFASKQWINEIFISHFHEKAVMLGIMHVMSHFKYNEVAPHGTMIAMAALVNSNIEVRESGIRAFENWCTKESLQVLESIHCEEVWLNEYLQQVIADLKEELGFNAIPN